MKNKLVLYFFLIVSLQLVAQNEIYEVFNTSINSRFAELGISYLNDSTVIYASSKKTDNDKSFVVDRRRNNRQLYVDLYSGKINNGDIINEQKFTKEVDNKFYVSDISFTNDQKIVYFTWNNFYNTTNRKDSAEWKTLHIVKAAITKDLDILSVEHLPFNSTDYSVRSPELSKDESQLFFISDMPGGYGATDIYVVDILENGTYSQPRNLGPNVNTKLPEMFPHAAENGNLYFSSYGHNSTGGLDIFKSNINNGEYEKAQKLPDPINTRVDDFAFVINEADNSGFFSSTRKKGKGDADIYSFIRIPLEIECSKEISGNILDTNTKEQLSNAHIQLIAEGEIIDEITTGNNGFYSFKVDCEIEYNLEVSKQNYENSELLFITNIDFEDKTTENILLTPKDCLQILNLDIVQQETNEIINDVSLKFFRNNVAFTPVKRDNTNFINIDCNSKYKIVAEKDGFTSNTISFVSSKEYDETLTKKIVLAPIKCYQNFTGTIVDKITQQELNNLKVNLIANNVIIDEINLNSFKLNFTLDCDKDYKIKVEKPNYKTTEFDISTTNELKKVIFETIELEPLECNQNINITVVDNFQEPLSGALIQLYKNNEVIKTIESNNKNSTLDFDCENTYKIVVSKENYISQEYGFTTSRQYDLGLTKQFELIEKVCNQIISGIVENSENNDKISNAKLSLYNGDNLIQTIFTNEDSAFSFKINCNNSYKLVVEKADFNSVEYEFDTDGEYDNTITKNILLDPLECNQTIAITLINSISKEAINDVSVSLFENDKLLETKLSSSEAEFSLLCKKQYKIVVSKENYLTKEYVFNTNNVHQNKLIETIELVENECLQSLSGVITDSRKKSILPNTKVSLLTDNNSLKTSFTNEKGEFNLQLNCNSNYKIIVDKPEFQTLEYELTTDGGFNKSQTKNLTLDPLECNQTIAISSINSISKEVINDVSISLFENDKLLETKTISGEAKFNLVCSKQYKIAVSKENYLTKEYVFNTDNVHQKNLKESIELVEKECVQSISGIITGSEKKSILPNTKVSLLIDDNLLRTTFTNEKGEFKLQLNCNLNYKIIVEKSEFQTLKYELKTDREFNKSQTKDLSLDPLKCNQTVAITSINSISKEVINDVSISLFENDKLLETKTISGEAKFNLVCSKQYKIAVSKENYLTKEYVFNTDNVHQKNLKESIELVEKECIQSISGIITDSEKNTVIPNVKVSLLVDSNLENSTFTNEKGEYNLQLNCNTNYKIVVDKLEFEIEEFDLNLKKEFNAIISKNVSLKPIPCNQTITGILVNDKNQEGIPNAEVKLFTGNNLLSSIQTDANGTYRFTIECEKTYKITGQHESYFISEVSVSTDKLAGRTVSRDIELSPKICSQSLSIIIADEDTNEQLSNLELTLTKDGTVMESISLKTKNLVLNIECNSTYKIAISKENYTNKVVEFSSTSVFYKKNSEIIKLKPLTCKQYISGKVLDKKLNSPIENATIEIYVSNNLISTHKSKKNGDFNIELDCNLNYKIITSAKDYLNDLNIINTTNEYNDEFKLDIYLNDKKSELFEEIENVRTVKMNPINFPLNESKITNSIAKELDKLIETLTKYPNLKLEIKNHTDSRAPDDYNLNLSEDRASSLVNYIISNGIEGSRVSGKGYGETELLNKCSNGVKCSEAEHQLNRRTKFIVTENN